jgi:opacity protein-like surface antigen
MMDRGVFGYTALALLMTASLQGETAMAADDERGFYVGAAAGYAEHDMFGLGNFFVRSCRQCPDSDYVDPDRVSADEETATWSIKLGYRVNRYLAAEVSYHDFGSASITEHYPTSPVYHFRPFTLRSETEVNGTALTILGSLPLSTSLSATLRGGMLYANQEVESDSPDLVQYPAYLLPFREKSSDEIWTAAAGVRWNFAPRWSTQLEYQVTDVFHLEANDYPRARSNKFNQTSLSISFDL